MHSLPVSICTAPARKHGDERKLLVSVAIEGPALKGDLLRERIDRSPPSA
jgi:hypothetical protein